MLGELEWYIRVDYKFANGEKQWSSIYNDMINLFQPSLGKEEISAVEAVFESQWIGQGSVTRKFARDWAERLDVPPSKLIVANSATAGLFSVAHVCEWKQGDEVILPAVSFVGAANAVAATGARPIFADVDPHTLNLTKTTFLSALTPRTKAVILLNYAGVPCEDLGIIKNICQERSIRLIVDNACSPFSRSHGIPTGLWGDFGIWSFDAMKILTCGDGGLIFAKDESLAKKIRRNLNLGLTIDSGVTASNQREWWKFDVETLSGRSISNDIACAIGIEQLKKVEGFLKRRKEIHGLYQEHFRDVPELEIPPQLSDQVESSYYMYWVQLKERNQLAEHLLQQGIYSNFRYWPLHKLKIYGFEGSLPNAEYATERTLNLPLHQSLSRTDVERVIESVLTFIRQRR